MAWAVFKRATETLVKGDTAAVTSDPVADARVTDIPVFEYLTNRVLHRASDDRNQAVWKELDVAAFLEAIKAPHRYFQDTQTRLKEGAKLRTS